jgi:hypothetical protein
MDEITLPKDLRRSLEVAVVKARDIAEAAAAEELKRLSVADKVPGGYLDDQQRSLRNRLRAHGRVIGDIRRASGEQEIGLLITEIAYQHWHRMLFARFLAENDLLIYEDGVTPLSIHDCFELAEEESGDRTLGWQYAARYASAMLPQIFRVDSPVLEVSFAPNDQKQLEQLLDSLDPSTFTASDSLGWVYQFWQSKHKDEVNASEVKIGAKELSPVTQLFTEPYMVSFLLDNALGAWWANQQLTDQDYANAQSEDELRSKVAIAGVPLQYLRFVKTFTAEQHALLDSEDAPDEKPEPEGAWEPAAGKFEQWPSNLGELKTLDPCCGSGHFLIAVFLMLVPLRMQREGLTEQQAIDAVLSQNIYGLELDQRCVELAVFALALEAWRYPNGGGYRPLPDLHLACSGLSIKVAKGEWKKLGLGKKNLTIALDWMHEKFSDAPVLGSLINPAKSDASKIVSWDELSETLNTALQKESVVEHDSEESQQSLEAAVVAQGMAKAATMLADQYQWVVTNVPYLARSKQNDTLKKYIESNYPEGKNDLATVFLDRSLELCIEGGAASIVLPQNWLFLTSYKKFRKKLLSNDSWHLIARLGPQAFQTPMWDFNVQLLTISPGFFVEGSSTIFEVAECRNVICGIDVSEPRTAIEKAAQLLTAEIKYINQKKQLENPDAKVVFEKGTAKGVPLKEIASALKGSSVGDLPRFVRKFWEISKINYQWEFHQICPSNSVDFGGREEVILWESERGSMYELAQSVKHLNHAAQNWLRGKPNWGKRGVVVSLMGNLPVTLYGGDINAATCTSLVLKDQSNSSSLDALWAFCRSDIFRLELRKLSQKVSIEVGTILEVRFDIDYWGAIAQEKYPDGIPNAYSDDPTQWIFHGHPCYSVLWNDNCKRIGKGSVRIDETVLLVAISRLLSYGWPAEFDEGMELADEQRECVNYCKQLQSHADDDGIFCIPAVRGEKSADQRLEAFLQAAYGDTWSAQTRNELLESVACKNKSLDFWLREKFFEQHCKLFQQRPFIWQIWDGLKDGFSALVNYHLLDRKNLERLIYTYLDDWIRTQKHDQSEGIDGAGVRLAAAEGLKWRLEQILEGEAPYDVFVRWKPLTEQPSGWNPDLNDGVRLNIRPFMSVEDVGKKGAGILRTKPNIHWKKDRGKDVESAPWYNLGLEYGGKQGDRLNDHHLSLAEKRDASKDLP